MRGNLDDARPVLVLLSGLPGAGKTTFAREFVRRTGAHHLESDAVRHSLFPSPAYTRVENAAVFGRIEEEARDDLAADRCAVVDATNLTRRDRARFLRLAETWAALIVGVRLTAPMGVLRTRLRARLAAERNGYAPAPEAVLERMTGRAEPFRIATLVVDTRFPAASALDLLALLIEDRS